MQNSILKQFSFDFKNILIDEIALGGLEGIGLDFLWRRLEKRMKSPVAEKMKARFWTFLVHCEALTFYKLPEPFPRVELKDRFEYVDEETGHILEPEDYLDGPYEYRPIDNEYGSSKYYKTRVLIPKETLQNQTYEMIFETFGDTLAMVASEEERFHSLAPHAPTLHLKELSKIQYCLLELIGIGRENGQTSTGKTNILKMIKDPKLVFYNRKFLQNYDLIKIQGIHQVTNNRSMISLLITLKRFHKPFLQTIPKHGKWYNIIQHLLEQPNYKDDCKNMLQQKYFTVRHCKRLSKSHNVFVFENIEGADPKKTQQMAYKTMRLELPSEESSQSDNEGNEEPLKCQYKIKVSLLRQAYEQIVKSGAQGLSMMQLAQLLGLEFYAIRTLCRCLKTKKIVKEYFVDVGKQKVAKYVALCAASVTDVQFEKEKKQYLARLEEGKTSESASSSNTASTSKTASTSETTSNSNTVEQKEDSDDDVPLKKIKIKKECDTKTESDIKTESGVKKVSDITEFMPDSKTIEQRIFEIKNVVGLENDKVTLLGPNKRPTLRQLKYANGILDVLKEKRVISGWHNLNQHVSKKISEPLLDNKPLKVLVQKLITDGQMKAIKMTWPIHHKTCIVFSAPNVPLSDPQLKEIYREINLIALRNKREGKKLYIAPLLPAQQTTRPLTMTIYPRYLRIQKLHETIAKFVYFNNTNYKPSSAPGFCALFDLIPEFTVDFVMGNMSQSALMELIALKISPNLLNEKIRDIPADLLKVFLTSYNLQNMWKMNLKNLAMLGLIQLLKQQNRNDDTYSFTYEFYVNPRVEIINTTGTWPREDADIDELKKCYEFNSFEDVENFWKDVYNISINTEITLDRSERVRKYPLCSPVFRHEVKMDGCSEVLGDGKGPCGYDSSFHMEKARFWALCHTKLKQQALLKKSLPKLPKLKVKKVPKPRAPRKKRKPKKSSGVDKKPVAVPVKKEPKKKKQKSYVVKWSKEEDKVIMLCKAAITVMSPSRTVGCLKIRNQGAKDILSLYDPKKTAASCHKRALLLETNTTFSYEKDCIINELKRYPNFLKKYENMIREQLRQHSKSLSNIYHVSRLHLLELVYIMLQLYKSESYKKKTPCVALNLEQFHEKYILSPSTANLSFNVYRTPLENGPVLAAIKEGIMVAVISSFKMLQTAAVSESIHSMFDSFSEEILRPALEELRKSGTVAVKEKIMVSSIDKFHAQDIVKTSFKLSTSYQRRWINRLNSEFVDSLIHDLHQEIPKTNVKGSPELNCILMELNACGIVNLISTDSPTIAMSSTLAQEEQITVQDMLMKYKLKSGALNWDSNRQFERFSDLIDVEYRDSWDELLSKSELTDNDIGMGDRAIVNILEEAKEQGLQFQEIQSATNYDTKTLVNKMKALESSHVIKRVGYYENVIVLTKYAEPWTLPLRDKRIIPTPWLTLDMDIRSDIFLKWSGTIMNKVFMNPGYSIAKLSEEVEVLTTRATQDICMLLEKCKCVSLKCAKEKEPDLFSDCDVAPELEDFHEYESVHNIFVFPEKDAIIKYATLKRKMSEEDPYLE